MFSLHLRIMIIIAFMCKYIYLYNANPYINCLCISLISSSVFPALQANEETLFIYAPILQQGYSCNSRSH